ncbi:hypothetical protein, partial [Enterocloster clostridioformis]
SAVYENRTYGAVRGRRLITASYSIFNVMAVGYVRGEGQGCVLRPPHEKKAKEELNCLQR